MKLFMISFILHLLVVSTLAANDMVKDQEWLKNYFTKIKKTYDKRIAPMGENGPGSAIKVNCSMYILDVSNVDDSNMDFTAQFYLRQRWNDSRLRFTDRDEVIVLRNADEVWTPDLFFTLSREGKLHDIVHPNAMLKISPSGEVFYSIRVTVKIQCQMDLSSFPHDIQNCEMRIESYAHTTKDIDMEWGGMNAVGYFNNITLHNFDLIAVDESDTAVNFTTGQYKVLIVTFTFQRKFAYFASKLYIPFIIFVLVSLLSLWIKAEERALRLSILVVILYFMINISTEVSYEIPTAPCTKGTDVWIGFCESLVFAIFLEFIAVALTSGRHVEEERKDNILMDMESDSKEESLKSDTLKSHLSKLVNMFDARNGGKGRRDESAYRIDKVCRFVFPLIFLLFNIVYWSVYCCK